MKTKHKPAVVLAIFDAPKMSAAERQKIVIWLHNQATTLANNHRQLANRWTTKYLR